MAEQNVGAFDMEQVDFDALYRGEAGFDGMDLSFDHVPWDIGEPQPELVELERAGRLRATVLDVGCGPGDNALFLARRGYTVTGVDSSPSALEDARRRAREEGADVRFVLDDVSSLDAVEPGFDTVVDSALYHCLGQEERQRYSAALHRVTRPGAELHLFCFADEGPGHFPVPLQVSCDDLRANLGAEWTISSIELVRYTARYQRTDVEKMNALVGGSAFDANVIEVDEHGRMLIPMWRLRAVRS